MDVNECVDYEIIQNYDISECFVLESFDTLIIQELLKDREKNALSPITVLLNTK